MITDEERREVARRLRETGEELGSAALLWYHVAKALGVRTATDGKTACGMLADLIEPETECTCRVESSREYENDGCYSWFKYELSCGHEVKSECQLPPSYCPECGKKVLYDIGKYL